MVPLGLLLSLALLPCSLTAQEVTDRFEGWHSLWDARFDFDPDQRSIRGFSVRDTSHARTTLAEAERAWEQGKPERAAHLLLELAVRAGSEVVQVADELEGSRWVGAGEWALYQLRSRVSPSVLKSLVSNEDHKAVQRAAQWRDLAGLKGLAWRLESSDLGREATALLARLLAERGEWEAARSAGERALSLGDDSSVEELLQNLPTGSEPGNGPLRMPASLERQWAQTFVIGVFGENFRNVDNPFDGYVRRNEARFAPIQPVVSENVIYLMDSLSVSAVDVVSGRALWHHAGPIERVLLDGTEDKWFDYSVYGYRARPRAINPYQVARPVLAGQKLLASVQVTEARHPLDEFDGYPINHPLPHRRLRALDRDTGEVLWIQEQPDAPDWDFVSHFDVAGPPAVGGGVVYASGSVTEGAINAYIAAFDLETGALLWRTLLCSGQQELTMFNRPFQEHLISPPLLADGSLYVSTNLGVVASVDAWSGRVRWVTGYEPIPRNGSSMVNPDSVARDIHWQNQEPFVEGGLLFVAPLDSRRMLALEPQTGRLIYRLDAFTRTGRTPVRHQVIPRGDGKLLVLTGMGIECYDARTGAVVWPHKLLDTGADSRYLDEITGATTRTGDTLLVPCARQLVFVDVWSGEVTGGMDWQSSARGAAVQRVVHAGSAFIMNDGRELSAAMDTASLVAEAEAALAARGDSPVPAAEQLLLAEVALTERRYEDAHQLFEQVLLADEQGAAPVSLRPEAARARARSGRLEASVRRARFSESAEDWSRVLAMTSSTEQLFEWAPTAFRALEREGKLREVSDWLTELSLRSPDRLLDYGDDGPQAARTLAARFRLPFVTVEEGLALLHELLLARPGAQWNGLPVRDEALRRIESMLELHGRDVYAEYEQRAQTELDRGLPLEVVEVRFPNALAVGRERASELDRLLEQGRSREAFEGVALLGASPGKLALRERAARALGEVEFADLLAGSRPLVKGMRPLPRLPLRGDGRLTHVLSPQNDVVFRQSVGHPSPEYAACALGVVDGEGEMFLLDASTGTVKWRGHSLPGGSRRVSAGLDIQLESDLYVVRAGSSVEVGRLSDGQPLWSATVPAFFSMATGGGLVFTLRELSDDTLRVDAFGLRTGAHAYSIDLKDAQSASDLQFVGAHLFVSTRASGPFGRSSTRRLVVLDIERGEVASSSVVDADYRVINTLADPPTVFLAARESRSRSKLAAWDPASASILWESDVPDGQVTSSELFPAGPGRMVYCESTALEGSVGHADILHPIDALRGPLDAPPGVPLFTVVDGDGGAATPLLVMRDPLSKESVCVVDASTGGVLYTLEFDTPLSGFTQAFQGADGYVIVSETSYQPSFVTSAWIVHGEDGEERYSVSLDEPSQRDSADVLLVDGAVLLAIRGTVHVIRDVDARGAVRGPSDSEDTQK